MHLLTPRSQHASVSPSAAYRAVRNSTQSVDSSPPMKRQRSLKVELVVLSPCHQIRGPRAGGDGARFTLDHGPERKTSRRTRQRDTYEIALGKGPRIPGLVLDAVGANSVRRKVRGSNLAQPVIPFRSATTLEHVLEFRTSRRIRQQATSLCHPGCGGSLRGAE